MGKRVLYLVAFITLTCLVACSGYEYQVPVETGDGWETASLAEVELDENRLSQAVKNIENGRYPRVHSLLIVKDGKLVFEEYWDGHAWQYDADGFEGPMVAFDQESRHTIMSITKAFTSALIGLAIDEGAIPDEQTPVFDFFPQYDDLQTPEKQAITLEHLLTMTSGLEWNEAEYTYSEVENDLIQLFIVEDPVEYILAKPLTHRPGSYWYYSGGDVNLLGEVIQEATGQRMDEYAIEHLFALLGITSYEWDFINPDTVHASGNLMLRPRDMAKFGALLLNEGTWQGEQIIPAEWIAKTKIPYITTPWPDQGEYYGYQWWLKEYRYGDQVTTALHRTGWGGQAIAVFDELDMVVVFTGGNYEDPSPHNEILMRHILPAVSQAPE